LPIQVNPEHIAERISPRFVAGVDDAINEHRERR